MKNVSQKVLYVLFITLLLIPITSCAAATSGKSKSKSGFTETKITNLPDNLLGIVPHKKICVVAGLNKENKQCLNIDGKEGPGFDSITPESIIFSSDGKRIVYIAQKDEQLLVVDNGTAGQEYAGIGNGTLVISPDGSKVINGCSLLMGKPNLHMIQLEVRLYSALTAGI
jgi:hypothetical protein